jgi:hypothetical protein
LNDKEKVDTAHYILFEKKEKAFQRKTLFQNSGEKRNGRGSSDTFNLEN